MNRPSGIGDAFNFEKVPINPKLPANFSDTPNDARPADHQEWWHRAYIETFTWEQMQAGRTNPLTAAEIEETRRQWFNAWPSGTRYDVRCLDGGAWDRPTCWGMFKTLEDALAFLAGRRSPGLFVKPETNKRPRRQVKR